MGGSWNSSCESSEWCCTLLCTFVITQSTLMKSVRQLHMQKLDAGPPIMWTSHALPPAMDDWVRTMDKTANKNSCSIIMQPVFSPKLTGEEPEIWPHQWFNAFQCLCQRIIGQERLGGAPWYPLCGNNIPDTQPRMGISQNSSSFCVIY